MIHESLNTHRWSEQLRVVAAGILAGMSCGVVAGIGARIAMRIVALEAGQRPSFSVGGSIAIVILGVVLGIPAGLLFIALRRWLPGPRLVKGLVLGLMLVLLFAWPFAAGNIELAISPRLGLALFLPLFVIAGVMVALVVAPLERRLPEPRRSLVTLGGYGVLMLLGIAGIAFWGLVVISSVLGLDI